MSAHRCSVLIRLQKSPVKRQQETLKAVGIKSERATGTALMSLREDGCFFCAWFLWSVIVSGSVERWCCWWWWWLHKCSAARSIASAGNSNAFLFRGGTEQIRDVDDHLWTHKARRPRDVTWKLLIVEHYSRQQEDKRSAEQRKGRFHRFGRRLEEWNCFKDILWTWISLDLSERATASSGKLLHCMKLHLKMHI